MKFQCAALCGSLCGAFIDVGVFVVLMSLGLWGLASGVSDMLRSSRKQSCQLASDQKCPHCDIWQSERGGYMPRAQCPPLRNPTEHPGNE